METAETVKTGKYPPRRVPNAVLRSREYLTPAEVDSMIAAANASGRYGFRDGALILIAYRHGLRVSELVSLRRDQVDFAAGTLHLNRAKGGLQGVHPLGGNELRTLRRLFREDSGSPFIFTSERRGPLSTSNVRKIISRVGKAAGIANAHPHQLRHGAGYALAARGTDTRTIQLYLGHKSITSTAIYTAMSPGQFRGIWGE